MPWDFTVHAQFVLWDSRVLSFPFLPHYPIPFLYPSPALAHSPTFPCVYSPLQEAIPLPCLFCPHLPFILPATLYSPGVGWWLLCSSPPACLFLFLITTGIAQPCFWQFPPSQVPYPQEEEDGEMGDTRALFGYDLPTPVPFCLLYADCLGSSFAALPPCPTLLPTPTTDTYTTVHISHHLCGLGLSTVVLCLLPLLGSSALALPCIPALSHLPTWSLGPCYPTMAAVGAVVVILLLLLPATTLLPPQLPTTPAGTPYYHACLQTLPPPHPPLPAGSTTYHTFCSAVLGHYTFSQPPPVTTMGWFLPFCLCLCSHTPFFAFLPPHTFCHFPAPHYLQLFFCPLTPVYPTFLLPTPTCIPQFTTTACPHCPRLHLGCHHICIGLSKSKNLKRIQITRQ